jgi:hypothetical protein
MSGSAQSGGERAFAIELALLPLLYDINDTESRTFPSLIRTVVDCRPEELPASA